MESWESLIGARMAAHLPVLHVPDYKKARKRYTNHLLYLRKKDLPEYKAQCAARQKRYRATDDYRTHHREEMRVWRAKKKQLTINTKEAQMPEIKLYQKDIENIANNRRQGGGSHTILEVCLARKVIDLQKAIKEINERNNGIFDTIYKVHCIINRKYGSQILQRTMNDATAAVNKIFIAPPYLDKREKPSTEKGTDNAERT